MSVRNHNGVPSGGDDLSRLFAQYRESLPDPEPDALFMPRLWRKIDARRSPNWYLKRWARGFLTAATAVSLLLGGLLALRTPPVSPFYTNTYLELLASQSPDTQADVEIVAASDFGG